MNIKRYLITQEWGEIEVTVDIDHDKLTPEIAQETNNFWMNSEERLEAADGDSVVAVIRLAAARFMSSLLEGMSIEGAQSDLESAEGWPPETGIKLVDYDGLPDINSMELQLEEIEL